MRLSPSSNWISPLGSEKSILLRSRRLQFAGREQRLTCWNVNETISVWMLAGLKMSRSVQGGSALLELLPLMKAYLQE